MQYLAIGVGALLGANVRFLVANWAADRWGTAFPFGTFIINVSGAFVIGVLLAFLAERVGLNPLWRLFFATGFLGGYTTFSTYAWEALTLAETGARLDTGDQAQRPTGELSDWQARVAFWVLAIEHPTDQ
jgi:fluoride exporter